MGLHSYTGIFTTYVKQMGRIIRRHSDVSEGVYGLYSSTTATKVDLRNCITMCLWPRRQEPVLPAAGGAVGGRHGRRLAAPLPHAGPGAFPSCASLWKLDTTRQVCNHMLLASDKGTSA